MSEIADAIARTSSALGEETADRLRRADPERWQRNHGAGGERALDLAYDLSFLEVAIRAEEPALWLSHVQWMKVLYASLGFDEHALERTLRCVCDVLEDRLEPAASEVCGAYLGAALEKLPDLPSTLPSELDSDEVDGPLARAYLEAQLAGDRELACRLVLDAAEAGVEVKELYLRVLQPCQRELGRLWLTQGITVAKEHVGTATTQLVMSRLAPRIFAGEHRGRRLMAACVGGELHEVGLRMIADIFEIEGWDTLFVGASSPEATLVELVERTQPHVLALSSSVTPRLPALERFVRAVRASPGCSDVRIMVGGCPFSASPKLHRWVGADGQAASPREAIALANRLAKDRASPRAAPRRDGDLRDLSLLPLRQNDVHLDELAQVNNELARVQRELAKRNEELKMLNRDLEQEVASRTRELDQQRSFSVRNDRLRALGEMAARVAHQLNQPLVGVRGGAEHLALSAERGWELSPEQVSETAGRIVEQADRMAHIIEHVRLFSREAGSPHTQAVDVREVIRLTLDFTTVQFRRRGLSVRFDEADELPLVEANPYSLEEVILNLLRNAGDAVEALPPDKNDSKRQTVEVRVRTDLKPTRGDDWVVVEIEDRGVGIPAEIADRVFEAFFTTKPSGQGMGLGLSIARSIVESFGGRLVLRSREGKGTMVRIVLPAIASKELKEGG